MKKLSELKRFVPYEIEEEVEEGEDYDYKVVKIESLKDWARSCVKELEEENEKLIHNAEKQTPQMLMNIGVISFLQDNIIERKCRVCGCTTDDCSQCIVKTGISCHWIEDDLCSACEGEI